MMENLPRAVSNPYKERTSTSSNRRVPNSGLMCEFTPWPRPVSFSERADQASVWPERRVWPAAAWQRYDPGGAWAIWTHCPRGTCYLSEIHSSPNPAPCSTRACCLLWCQKTSLRRTVGPPCLPSAPSSMAIHCRMLAHTCRGAAITTFPGTAGTFPGLARLSLLPGQAWGGHLLFWAVHPRGGSVGGLL